MNDETRVLRTRAWEPVWDLDLYELPSQEGTDTLPPLEVFQDSGRYYAFKDRIIWSMIEFYLDSSRIAFIHLHPGKDVDEWYGKIRPRLSDSLNARYPYEYQRFEGELHLTEDTVQRWLGDMDSFETCGRSMSLAQVLKPGHWYLYVFDTEGPTHALGRGHYVERRVSFYVDAKGATHNWRSVRQRRKKMRIV